jgi:phosphohistidine phosphatase
MATGADATGGLPRNLRGSPTVIWLLRHGDAAADAPDDSARPLTSKGERQSVAAGRALRALGVELDTCLTSPKVRAEQTAQLACEPFGIEPELARELAGGDFDPDSLGAGRGEVLLVGHEPDFSRAIQATTGARVELKKGGIAAIGGAALHVLLRPSEIKRIA